MIAKVLSCLSASLLVLACGGGGAASAPARSTAATPADGPELKPREIGTLSPGECSTKTFLGQMGSACAGLPARNAAAAGGASAAADGDVCTVWNSGGLPPQSFIIDLEKDTTFNGFLLVPEMTPPEGDVIHVIERSNDGAAWTTIGVIKAHMADDHVYGVTFAAPVTARLVRITTNASPSWVAWGEAEPVRCG
jgi:hypothetical protein